MSSDYVRRFLSESKREANEQSDRWLKRFFSTFHEALTKNIESVSSGNRKFIESALGEAMQHLVPRGVEPQGEISFFKSHKFDNNVEEKLKELLQKKRFDFVLTPKTGKKQLLIEVKINATFNDIAAAMVKMKLAKEIMGEENIRTASLHLSHNGANLDGIRCANRMFGQPLDKIWVLRSKDRTFDIKEIRAFRKYLLEVLK
jgi:hypothetical protein